jgi:NAD(P) transhydrogenase subunit beta
MEYLRSQEFINILYLVASVFFIFGLKGLTHPRTAVRGNFFGALAMFIAIIGAMLDANLSYLWIGIGVGIGTVIGAFLAVKIEMTAMPQLVALFNGFGGLASVLVAAADLWLNNSAREEFTKQTGETLDLGITYTVSSGLAGLIGAVTLTGSLIAFAKLQELKAFKKPMKIPAQTATNMVLLAVAVGLTAWFAASGGSGLAFWIIVAVALVLGITLTGPIGGADMPVVVALLNSYSGLAASATGFVIGNNVLIVAGSLVGASGLILTNIMCKAMNRSLWNVLFGVMGAGGEDGPTADEVYEGKIKRTSADELAMMLEMCRKVIIVPGYGLAVAQAQHAVRDLMNLMEEREIEVLFGIHPVAGRMPGHMNVLLAESQVPYDKLIEMDDCNPLFADTDMVFVIGANDVVNPEARENPKSPIAGMPILDVDHARTVVVIKRSLSHGYAGIPNPLFAMDNTLMYFGDGKQTILDLITAIKES